VRVSKFDRILEEAQVRAFIAWPVRFIIPGCLIY
jgi:hypothetical protein